MADQVAIVTGTTPASPGTLDLTSSALTGTVKAALFFFGTTTTDGSVTDHGCLGVGMWANDGETNSPGGESFSSHFFRCTNGETGSTGARGWKDVPGFATIERDATPAVDLTVTAIAAISNGVRLTFGQTDYQLKITAIIFAGIARSWSSTIAVTTSLTHENTGGAGQEFQPDILIVAGSDGNFGALVDDFRGQLGFVVGTAHSGAAVDIDRGTDPTDADGVVDGVRVPFMVAGSGGTAQGATFTPDSTGYNHQLTSGTGSPDISVLALKFSEPFLAATDNLAVSSSTGVQSFSLGIKPRIVIGMSTLIANENTVTDGATAATAGFFVFDQTAARAYSGGHREGVEITAENPSVSKSIQGDFAVATIADTGTVAQQAVLSSLDTLGFSLNFSTATAGFLSVLGLSFGTVVSDTEEISDQTALNVGLATTDTEEISDSVVLSGTGNVVVSETEEISDAVAFSTFLVVSETEEIADVAVFLTASGIGVEADPFGWTYSGGAERGGTFQGGAVMGTVL